MTPEEGALRGRPSKYPPEFRREAVDLVKTSERPRVEIVRSLGISDNTLADWIAADREAQTRSDVPNGLSETERDELRRLRKENIELRTDREILQGRSRFNRSVQHESPWVRWRRCARSVSSARSWAQSTERSSGGTVRRRV